MCVWVHICIVLRSQVHTRTERIDVCAESAWKQVLLLFIFIFFYWNSEATTTNNRKCGMTVNVDVFFFFFLFSIFLCASSFVILSFQRYVWVARELCGLVLVLERQSLCSLVTAVATAAAATAELLSASYCCRFFIHVSFVITKFVHSCVLVRWCVPTTQPYRIELNLMRSCTFWFENEIQRK